MAAANPTDTATSRRVTRPATDRVALTHLALSAALLVPGAALWALSVLDLRFPSLLTGPFSYGRLRPMALALVVLGWLTMSLIGGIYFALPRLTGARIFREDLAAVGGWSLAVLSLVAATAVGLGLGDGSEPFGLPVWLDVPIVLTLLIPTVVTIGTVARRTEKNIFVSLWYALAGVLWLPVLMAVGSAPGLTAVGRSLQGTIVTHGLINLWVVGAGTGLAYYVVVKVGDRPLASRQLARVGFWSLAFAAAWPGVLPLSLGPAPDWLDTVAAVLTLALPVAALAVAANLIATVGSDWPSTSDRPAVHAATRGVIVGAAGAVLTAIAGLDSVAAMLAPTAFWDGVVVVTGVGAGSLLSIAWQLHALPATTGRDLNTRAFSVSSIRTIVWGTAIAGLGFGGAGLVQGYLWTGGSFAGAFEDTGPGWVLASGPANLLLGVALLGALVLAFGLLMHVLVVYRTITAGAAVPQEVLVTRQEST